MERKLETMAISNKTRRHLNLERWYYIQPNGKPRMKRVSAAAEKQFPREYRKVLADGNLFASILTKYIMDKEGLSLHDAWNKVKDMVGWVPRS